MSPCYVYIMTLDYPGDDEIMKVGISASPGGRLMQFRTANPFPVYLTALWRFPTREDALWVERTFHEENHMPKFRGEWFRGPYPGAADMLLMLAGRCWIEHLRGSVDGLREWLRACGVIDEDTLAYVVGEMEAYV